MPFLEQEVNVMSKADSGCISKVCLIYVVLYSTLKTRFYQQKYNIYLQGQSYKFVENKIYSKILIVLPQHAYQSTYAH